MTGQATDTTATASRRRRRSPGRHLTDAEAEQARELAGRRAALVEAQLVVEQEMRALPWFGDVVEQELADVLGVARLMIRGWKAGLG